MAGFTFDEPEIARVLVILPGRIRADRRCAFNFMQLIHRAVHRPVTIAMCIIAMVVFGFVSFQRIGLDLLPNLELPVVAIVTPYPNADPRTVEREVTTPIENALATLKGLRKLESESIEHASIIMAHFHWGTDIGEAMDQLNVFLNVISATLPADAHRPLVLRFDPSQLPVMLLGLTGDQSPAELTDVADRRIRPLLESLPGVAQVSVLGGIRPEISIYYSSDVLMEMGLTPFQLQQAIEYQNVMIPAGSRTFTDAELGHDGSGETRYLLRVGSAVSDIDDLGSIIVGQRPPDPDAIGFARQPRPLTLAQVATIVDGYSTPEGFTRIDGSPAILIQVMKQAGENTVAVTQQIRDALERLNIESLLPGARLHIITDQSTLILDSLENVGSTAVVGGVLAVVILLLFLRNWRSLTIIGFSIPLSILLTFICLYFFGFNLNLMTLGGLAIGIGMLVDNSIVVLENIFRLRGEGLDYLDAAKQGAAEMASPIVASTVTTVAVFVPLIFSHSMAGHLARELAVAVSLALTASLIVALFIVPPLSAHLGRKTSDAVTTDQAYVETDMRWLTRLQSRYGTLLERFVQRPLYTVGIVVLCGLGLIGLPGRLHTEVLPPLDGGMIKIQLTLPPGSPITATDQAAQRIEEALEQYGEVAAVAVYAGDQGGTSFLDLIQEAPVNVAEITVLLTPASERNRTAHEFAAELREKLPIPPGAILRVSADRATDGLGEDFAMAATIKLTGPELEELEVQAARIAERLRNHPGFTNVTSTAEAVQPELIFHINRDRVLGLGRLTTAEIALTMRASLLGQEVTHIRRDGMHVPVVLRPAAEELATYEALQDFRVFPVAAAESGYVTPVIFGRTGTDESPIIEWAPRSIQHIDRQRAVTITAELNGIDLSESQRIVEEILADVDLPVGYSARLAGIHDTLQEAMDDLGLALILAVIFVYLVMAAQFESIKDPLIILFCIPLATVGGLIALLLSGHMLNVPSAMGLIALAGVSVNNGIVLINTYNRLRREGYSVDAAIVTGSKMRLRPVLMTSLTTILALIPLALGIGSGADLQAPLAVAMIGGLISSMVFTLFIIPGIYRMTSRTDMPVPMQQTAQPPV